MKSYAVAVSDLLATANVSNAGSVPDAEALEIVRKHCAMCHTAKPTHQSFREAPKTSSWKRQPTYENMLS
jgi:uncharacterized membrane protein